MNTITIEMTHEQKFSELGKKLRKAGIYVRRNVVECCRGCVSFGDDAKNETNFWSFAGQGRDRLQFDRNGVAVAVGVDAGWRYEEPLTEGWLFYHTGLNNADRTLSEAGHALVDAIREVGLDFEWEDNDPNRAIVLKFPTPEIG